MHATTLLGSAASLLAATALLLAGGSGSGVVSAAAIVAAENGIVARAPAVVPAAEKYRCQCSVHVYPNGTRSDPNLGPKCCAKQGAKWDAAQNVSGPFLPRRVPVDQLCWLTFVVLLSALRHTPIHGPVH